MSNITISNFQEYGALTAIRGVRQSYKTTDKSDSCYVNGVEILGPKDYNLLLGLSKKSESERKFLRQMTISCDIKAPLYWWKQFDTYKVGTTAQSESTMHTLTKKPFEDSDFAWSDSKNKYNGFFDVVISQLNYLRKEYLTTTDKDEKKYLETLMIQLLPSGYFQKRTVTMNYCVLSHIYHDRYDHKLPEWRDFCDAIVGNIRYPAFIEPTPSVPSSGIPDIRNGESDFKEETWDATKRYCPFCGEELRIGEQGGYFCPNEDCDELKTTTDHDLVWFDCDYVYRLAQGRIEGKEATFCPFCGETLVETGDGAKYCPNRNDNVNYPLVHNFFYKQLPKPVCPVCKEKLNLWKNKISNETLGLCKNNKCYNCKAYDVSDMSITKLDPWDIMIGMLTGTLKNLDDED